VADPLRPAAPVRKQPISNGPVVPPSGTAEPPLGTAGQRLFARYAYAPNHLGYCGPGDSASLAELASTGRTAGDVGSIASRFSGAWPYLCVLAELTGIDDPLDEQLVRAYWTGSPLLDGVDRARFWRKLLDRIAAAGAGRYWAHLTPALLSEAMPSHGFHVFGVYPWTRLLSPARASATAAPAPSARAAASGSAASASASAASASAASASAASASVASGPALQVLDSCRIRWGRVVAVDGDHAVVRGRRLAWDGQALRLGGETEDSVRLVEAGRAFVTDVSPGDWLAVHWDRACDRLAGDELSQLRRWTDWQLAVTNARLARESPGR
jgi:Family of unknown function (DUF6390)